MWKKHFHLTEDQHTYHISLWYHAALRYNIKGTLCWTMELKWCLKQISQPTWPDRLMYILAYADELTLLSTAQLFIYNTIYLVSWRLKSRTFQLYVQQLAPTNKTTRFSHYWPFARGIQWTVDFPIKGSVMWKVFPYHDAILLSWRDRYSPHVFTKAFEFFPVLLSWVLKPRNIQGPVCFFIKRLHGCNNKCVSTVNSVIRGVKYQWIVVEKVEWLVERVFTGCAK